MHQIRQRPRAPGDKDVRQECALPLTEQIQPLPAGDSLVRGQYYFEASVANEKGKSNAIAFSYHNAN